MQDGKHVILCIDDDDDIIFFLKTVLEKEGYVMVQASTGEEGLKVYKQTNPDLIICDLMMEEVDAGVSFAKELKVIGNAAPVFLLSSVGDDLNMEIDYTSLGLAGVFQKPLDSGHLLSVMKSKLG